MANCLCCARIPSAIVCLSPTYVLQDGGKTWRFERMAPSGEPVLVNRKGDILNKAPPPTFWAAFARWLNSGGHVDSEGNCV